MSYYSPPERRQPQPPFAAPPPPPPPYSRPTDQPQQLAIPLGSAFWTYILLGIIVIVFLIETAFPILAGISLRYLPSEYMEILDPAKFRGGSENPLVLVLLGANFKPLVAEGQVWRLFTSMFLHIGLMHLVFNSYALYIFGGEMERVFGNGRFLVIYVLSGLFGSLASFALSPGQLSAGASGAIFGVVGMQTAYFLRHKDVLGEFGRSRLMNAFVIIGINLVFGFSVPGIDNLAHIGGLVAGLLLGFGLAPTYRVVRDRMGWPHLVDASTIQSQFWVLIVAVLVFTAGTFVALLL